MHRLSICLGTVARLPGVHRLAAKDIRGQRSRYWMIYASTQDARLEPTLEVRPTREFVRNEVGETPGPPGLERIQKGFSATDPEGFLGAGPERATVATLVTQMSPIVSHYA